MDSRTGEIFTPEVIESARQKVEAGKLDDLTGRERNFILAGHHGMVAWVTPEVAEQVERGQEAILKKSTEDIQAMLREHQDKRDGKVPQGDTGHG